MIDDNQTVKRQKFEFEKVIKIMITHPIDKINKIEVFDLQVSEQSTLVVEYTDISLSSLWATPSWRSSSSGSSSQSASQSWSSDFRLQSRPTFALLFVILTAAWTLTTMAIWISKSSTRQIIKLSEEQNYPNYNCINSLLFYDHSSPPGSSTTFCKDDRRKTAMGVQALWRGQFWAHRPVWDGKYHDGDLHYSPCHSWIV